jgi:hypothetical protein
MFVFIFIIDLIFLIPFSYVNKIGGATLNSNYEIYAKGSLLLSLELTWAWIYLILFGLVKTQDSRVSNCLGNNVIITIFEEYPYYNTLSLPFYFLKKSFGTYYV